MVVRMMGVVVVSLCLFQFPNGGEQMGVVDVG